MNVQYPVLHLLTLQYSAYKTEGVAYVAVTTGVFPVSFLKGNFDGNFD